MTVRSLFLVLLVCGVASCTTEKLYTADTKDGLVQIPRPVVTEVTFIENPATVHFHDDGSDPCAGRSLTEDEVKEYFRVAEIIDAYETNAFIVTPCQVYGDVMLKDGRSAMFRIDLIRVGKLQTSDGQYIHYYCNDCQNEKFEEACDLECIQKSLE
jgi:hypothetical protein